MKKILKLLIIVLIIRSSYKIYVFNFKYNNWTNMVIKVDVYCVDKINDENIRYIVKYRNDKFYLTIKDKNTIYKCGERLTILCSNYKVKKYNNPYEFNYKLYLNSNNIVSNIYCLKVLNVEDINRNLVFYITKIRKNISNKLDESFDTEKANLIKSFMYGDDLYLNNNIKNIFINIGLGHILCVSGTHIAYLLKSFKGLTKSKSESILNIILLIYFYCISLFNISLLRPIIMYFLSFIFKKMSFYQKYFLSLFIVLTINIYYVFNVGIIFSFVSILSIKLFYELVSSFCYIKIKRKNKIIRYIVDNISLTISSQILIFPFLLFYFQKLSIMCILSNLLISCIINIFLYLIFTYFFLMFIPILSNAIIFLCNFVIDIIIFEVEFLDKINYFNISFPKAVISFFISYYLLIFIFLYSKKAVLISWKRRKIIKKVCNYIKYICFMYCILWYFVIMYLEKYVIFFNVGQGNMCLIHKNNTNIIVDIGSTQKNLSGNIMINFLKAKNIKNIDMIIITHFHSDHINGIEKLIEENVKIASVCYTVPPKKKEEYENLKLLLKKNKIGCIQVVEGDNITINNIEVNVLTPPKDKYINDDDILNANSTVYLISNDRKNMLFMGDSTQNTEKYILKKYDILSSDIKTKLDNISIYQVSHHGSNTSSYDKFVSKISAKNAVFSAQKSIYGHPDDSIVELFKRYNYNIFITEKSGAIKF